MATAYRRLVQPKIESKSWMKNSSWVDFVREDRDDDLEPVALIARNLHFVDRRSAAARTDVDAEAVRSRQWPALSSPSDSRLHRPANRDDPNHAVIEALVLELREDAAEEGEDYNAESAAHLLKFCHDLAADVAPAVARMANGNLRAIWQNQRKDQIGIQFMPDGELQYVILRDRRGRTLKTLGFDDAGTIERIVATLRLTRLWYNG